LPDDGADDRVEAGAVTPAGQHADTHQDLPTTSSIGATASQPCGCPCSILRRAPTRRLDGQRSDGVPATPRGRVMDDEASPEPNTGSDGGASIQPVPADASFHADQHRMPVPLERRLRRLAGRKGAYRGPIVANTRGWVSRDTRWHIFAARFLD